MQTSDLAPGQIYDFGEIIFTPEEIIDFAKRYDPLPFHTDPDYAAQSHFKTLVASGPHIFNAFYLREWIPRFGHTVFAGRGVSSWEMLKPVYPGIAYHATAEVLGVYPKPEKGYAAVEWKFVFTNPEGNIVQHLHLTVMHMLR